MSYYLSTKDIPGLSQLPLKARLEVLALVSKRFNGIERLTLNLIKLLAITGGFVCLYQMADDWRAVFGVVIALLCYPVVLKPVYYQFCTKHIKQADIEKVKQASEQD